MMSGPHRDAELIQDTSQIVGMHPGKEHAENTGPHLWISYDTAAVGQHNGLNSVQYSFRLCGQSSDAEPVEKINSCPQADGAHIVWGAGFKAVGQGGIAGVQALQGGDHPATEERGTQVVQQFPPAVEDADAGKGAQLMAGEGEVVAAQPGYIHRPVKHRLGAVHQYLCPSLMGQGRHSFHRIDGADGVGDPGHADQAGLPRSGGRPPAKAGNWSCAPGR